MAKLENVKIIEATGGEITKVEHGGISYVKAEGEPQVGDLVYSTLRVSDTEPDSFYEVVECKTFLEDAIIDEEGDSCMTEFPGSVRFKKEEETVKPGDKIRITDPVLSEGRYGKGDVLTVEDVDEDGDVYTEELGRRIIIQEEFEVI